MTATTVEEKRTTRAGKTAVLCLCIALISILSLWLAIRSLSHHIPFFGLYQDDAIYVVTAKSLAEGAGYRIESLPGNPLQTKYPILFPLLLSIIWRLYPNFPANLHVIESFAMVLALGFAWLAAAYLLRSRRTTLALSAVIGGATILNIKLLSFAPIPMSDFLYGILSVLSLAVCERIASRQYDGSTWRSLILAALIALSALTRTAGLVLLPVCAVFLLCRRKLSAALTTLAACLLVLGPYWWWCRSNEQVSNPFLIFYTSYSQWTFSAYKDVGFTTIVDHKLGDLFTSFMQVTWPFLDAIPYKTLDPVGFFLIYRAGYSILWLLLILGCLSDICKPRRSLLAIYTALYLVSMIIWPGFMEWRHILVILPFVYFLYFRGFRTVSRLIKGRLSTPHRVQWQKLCAVTSIVFSVYLVVGAAIPSVTHAGNYPRRLLHRDDINAVTEEEDCMAAYDWIRKNTSSGAGFICTNDPLLYLYTGRTAMSPSPFEGWRSHSQKLVVPGSLISALRTSGADYLLLDPTYGGGFAVYDQLVSSTFRLYFGAPGVLKPAYKSPHAVMLIFKVDKDILMRLPSGLR